MKDPYPGNYLAADDLGGQDVTLTIAEVIEPNTEKAADNRLIDKVIVRFQKAHKRLICSKINWRILKLCLGPRWEEWPGQQITLTTRFIDAFGERDCPCVRVVPPEHTPLPFGVRKHYGAAQPQHTNPQAA